MEMKSGYKQSEVGIIPEDWKNTTIGEICITGSGTTPSRAMAERFYKNGSVHWVKTMDLNNSEILTTDELVTAAALNETSLTIYPIGTVLIAMYGGFVQIGRTGILKIPAAVNQAITAVQCPRRYLNPDFLLFTLNYQVDYWKKIASSSRKDPNITSQDIRNFPIVVPSLPEQRAIAEALSDVDALLAALDRLIAKQRDLKQATMQQLLTGQTRLPGFTGEWEVKWLGEICAMKSGDAITSANIDQFSKYPCYGGNGVRGFTSRFTHDGSYALIGRQGALCGNVFGVKGQFFASEHAVVVTASAKTDIEWLTYILERMNLNQYSESSAQPGLSVSKILNLELVAPPTKDEQRAIATVLADMDAELTALEQRRAKTRLLKQAMMQELLTGRTRLVG